MSAGITRINGYSKAGTLHGGYQIRLFTVAGSGFYTDAATGYVNYVANSPYEKAVRNGIQQLATITFLGTPTSAGFVVGIDGDSYYGRDDATGYATPDQSAGDLQAAIYTAIGGASTVTVTEVVLSGVGLIAGTVANWDNIV